MIVLRSVLVGVFAAAAGTVPWAILAGANTRHQPAVPWTVPIMAIYLLRYWRYFVRGWGWPQSTAEARRVTSRANSLSSEAWGAGGGNAAAAVYRALAYLTDSTLPGIVLHAGGNMFSVLDLLARGRSEWQLTTEVRPLIWETGPDAAPQGPRPKTIVV